jgi:hypothetical protein
MKYVAAALVMCLFASQGLAEVPPGSAQKPAALSAVRAGDVTARTIERTSQMEMKILTGGGFVAFMVSQDWGVISMQSKLPVANAVFKLPNAAEEETPDSTNLALLLYDSSERGRAAFDAPLKQLGDAAPEAESLGEWQIYRQKAKQGDTMYSILDAKRDHVADVSVKIRLAWPHLAANVADYDTLMESIFRAFLNSIHGQVGPYTPAAGEELYRHPTK